MLLVAHLSSRRMEHPRPRQWASTFTASLLLTRLRRTMIKRGGPQTLPRQHGDPLQLPQPVTAAAWPGRTRATVTVTVHPTGPPQLPLQFHSMARPPTVRSVNTLPVRRPPVRYRSAVSVYLWRCVVTIGVRRCCHGARRPFP